MRNSTTYEIVSNADTILLLKNPGLVFAEWTQPVPPNEVEIAEEEAIRSPLTRRKLSKKEQKLLKKRLASGSSRHSSHEPVIGNQGFAASQALLAENGESSSATATRLNGSSEGMEQNLSEAGPSEIQHTFPVPEMVEPGSGNSNDLSSVIMIDDSAAGAVPQAMTKPEEEGIRFQVCAGNLKSASPWFNRALNKDVWMESSRNPEDGWFRIIAQDWDEEAFLILMNVLHLRNHKVPRTLTLQMLAKFALLVDYYECNESVDLAVSIWVADLRVKAPIPTTYCRDLILWIWISWTFKLSDLFKQATAVAIRQSTEPIHNLGLPIPVRITDRLISKRYWAMEAIVSGLTEQVNVYRSATYTCPISTAYSFQCGSMLMGALTKRMDSLDLISPQSDTAFLGHTFDALCVKARSIESETWFHSHYSPHSCNLETAVGSIIDLAVTMVAGLDLSDESA